MTPSNFQNEAGGPIQGVMCSYTSPPLSEGFYEYKYLFHLHIHVESDQRDQEAGISETIDQ